MKLTTKLTLAPRLRMSGTIPPLPKQPSRCAEEQPYFSLSLSFPRQLTFTRLSDYLLHIHIFRLCCWIWFHTFKYSVLSPFTSKQFLYWLITEFLLKALLNSHQHKHELATGHSVPTLFDLLCRAQVKGKLHLGTDHDGPQRENRHSSIISLILALDGGQWSTPRTGRYTPGKETRYPLYSRMGWPHGRSRRVRKISPPPEFDPRTSSP